MQTHAQDCTSVIYTPEKHNTPKCIETQQKAPECNPFLQVADKQSNPEKAHLLSLIDENWDDLRPEQQTAIKTVIQAMIPMGDKVPKYISKPQK